MWTLHLITDVLKRQKGDDAGEGATGSEAEAGGMWPRAQGHQEPQKLEEAGRTPRPPQLRKEPALPTPGFQPSEPDLGLPGSGTVTAQAPVACSARLWSSAEAAPRRSHTPTPHEAEKQARGWAASVPRRPRQLGAGGSLGSRDRAGGRSGALDPSPGSRSPRVTQVSYLLGGFQTQRAGEGLSNA